MVNFIVSRALKDRELLHRLGVSLDDLIWNWAYDNKFPKVYKVYREIKGGGVELKFLIAEEFTRFSDYTKFKILISEDPGRVENAVREKLDELSDERIEKIYCKVLAKEL
ncbi:MAG: hypothetical protein QW356_02115 [Candidatus Hadarchaeales archaeon]